MDLQLKDKSVVVTGAGRGIGAGIAKAFGREGAVVALVDRSAEAARETEAAIAGEGGTAAVFEADLTDADALAALVPAVVERFGGIDVLVNNAGGNDAVGLRHSVEAFEASLRKNVVHFFAVTHHALDALLERGGVIVNIGSKCAVTGQGGTSGYAASKGAINALTREWALDLAPHGIRVNCVVPSEVITPLYEEWLAGAPDPAKAREQLDRTIPFGRRTTTVEEIADTVVFVASARSTHTTGQILFVDGGYVHLDRACTMDTSHLKSS